MPMELLLRDLPVSELWVDDKMARKASHQAAVGLLGQLEALLGPGVHERCRVPDSVLLRPLAFGEKYVRLSSGVRVVVNKAAGLGWCKHTHVRIQTHFHHSALAHNARKMQLVSSSGPPEFTQSSNQKTLLLHLNATKSVTPIRGRPPLAGLRWAK